MTFIHWKDEFETLIGMVRSGLKSRRLSELDIHWSPCSLPDVGQWSSPPADSRIRGPSHLCYHERAWKMGVSLSAYIHQPRAHPTVLPHLPGKSKGAEYPGRRGGNRPGTSRWTGQASPGQSWLRAGSVCWEQELCLVLGRSSQMC